MLYYYCTPPAVTSRIDHWVGGKHVLAEGGIEFTVRNEADWFGLATGIVVRICARSQETGLGRFMLLSPDLKRVYALGIRPKENIVYQPLSVNHAFDCALNTQMAIAGWTMRPNDVKPPFKPPACKYSDVTIRASNSGTSGV